MAEDPTLLAHLVPRLTSQVEDAATDALAFILNRSAACRRALHDLLGDSDLEPIDKVRTQVTYKDGSRPDMVGYDENGAKRLIVESKFWASLLEGQASDYFRQLEEVGPGVLLFIAPGVRFDTLWAEISRQMESGKEPVQLEAVETAGQIRRAKVAGSDKRLMLVSWIHLLDRMATAVDDTSVRSDIDQLLGLARREDDEAFLPIRPKELGLALPRRIRGLNHLLDDVVDGRGVPQGWMDISGVRATPQREGYGRYFSFPDVSGYLFLCVDYSLWATRAETPLWLRISNEVQVNTEEIRDRVPSSPDSGGQGYYAFEVPIYLKTGVEYEDVLSDVVRQVKEIKDACIADADI